MRIKDICEANYFKADKTFRQKSLPTLEPDPVDNAEPFDVSKHDVTSDDRPDIDISNAQVRAKVTQMLLKLPPRLERILRERFFQGLTLDQIIEKYGISRERIRQIEAKALRMLKHPSRANVLKPLLNNDVNEADVWDKPNPVKNHKKLSPANKAAAKRRAKAAGRPYPNMVDNIWAAKK